jgi:acetyltransferase-like isoleucine patch superfamily enzyme
VPTPGKAAVKPAQSMSVTVVITDQSPMVPGKRAGTMRDWLKAAARAVTSVLVLPLLAMYWLKAALVGHDRALEDASELLAIIPGLVGRYLRRAFLARVLVSCHPTATIGFGTLFSKVGASIGANVYIGPRCHIGLATLEDNVLLAAGVHVTSGTRTHGFDDLSRPIREQEGTLTLVRIGAGAWLGSAAVIMADVGADTIVGAGSVVTRPLPREVIAAGTPAHVIRSRRNNSANAKTDQERREFISGTHEIGCRVGGDT